VRVRREDLTVFDMRRSWVKAREFATRQKAFSGFGPSWWEYRQGESKSSDQQVNSTPAAVICKDCKPTVGQHIGRKGFRLGCACG
jgi:hypothetical protein